MTESEEVTGRKYAALLYIRGEAARAEKMAAEVEKPWKEMALKIAMEVKGLQGDGHVVFEPTRFRVACQGTGIYREESWWESFPIELLLRRMNESTVDNLPNGR